MPTFKSKHQNEIVYLDGVKVQFRNYLYTTEDKKVIAELGKVKNLEKVTVKAETPTD